MESSRRQQAQADLGMDFARKTKSERQPLPKSRSALTRRRRSVRR